MPINYYCISIYILLSFFWQNVINSDLDAFRFNWFFAKNSVRLLSDFCNRFKASSEIIEEEKTIQSSAYWTKVQPSYNRSCMSLTYKLNNNGTSTVPCRTPRLISIQSEKIPLMFTFWIRLFRKLEIKAFAPFEKPRESIFSIKTSCEMESKSLERSNEAACTIFFESIWFRILSVT